MERSYDFGALKNEIRISVKEHYTYSGVDGALYNGTVALVIILTAAAALLPQNYINLMRILSGIAAILSALHNALHWGARWIYHRQMRHEYLAILARISFFENMPETFSDVEKKAHFLEIYTSLYNVRKREMSVPGVSERYQGSGEAANA